MAVKDDQEPEGEEAENYKWLVQQLQALAQQGGVELGEADDEWQDSTGGALAHLINAVEEGDLEETQEALKAEGLDLNLPGPDGDSALHLACLYGHTEIALLLLERGANAGLVNAEDRSTPLHDACAGGYTEIIEKLLQLAPESLKAADEDGDTPLHHAARGGHLDVVKMLLAAGADKSTVNEAGNTPAGEAEEQEIKDCLEQDC